MSKLEIMGQRAKEASYDLGVATVGEKNNALIYMAEELLKAKDDIIEANKIDLKNAKEKGISDSMLDRLELNLDRINAMADGLNDMMTN